MPSSTRLRFSLRIRHLMIAVMVIAIGCYAARVSPLIAWLAVLAIPQILTIVVVALVPATDGGERSARAAIAVLVVANLVLVAADLWFVSSYARPLAAMFGFVTLLVVFSLLLLWGRGVCRKSCSAFKIPGRSIAWAALLIGLAATTIVTKWPTLAAFSLSRPWLDALADSAAQWHAFEAPTYAGFYRIVATEKDPATGNVALIIDDNPAGPTGFVRLAPGAATEHGPIFNHTMNLRLSERWRLQEED